MRFDLAIGDDAIALHLATGAPLMRRGFAEATRPVRVEDARELAGRSQINVYVVTMSAIPYGHPAYTEGR